MNGTKAGLRDEVEKLAEEVVKIVDGEFPMNVVKEMRED